MVLEEGVVSARKKIRIRSFVDGTWFIAQFPFISKPIGGGLMNGPGYESHAFVAFEESGRNGKGDVAR